MGGQYEPHFDFSRVRPEPRVHSWGPSMTAWRRLELLGALQPPHSPPHLLPHLGKPCLIGEAQIWKHRAWGAQCSLAISPALTLVLFAGILKLRTSLGLCENFSHASSPSPCHRPSFLHCRLFCGEHAQQLPLSLWPQSFGWGARWLQTWVKVVVYCSALLTAA